MNTPRIIRIAESHDSCLLHSIHYRQLVAWITSSKSWLPVSHIHTRLTALCPGLPAGASTHTHTHPFNGPFSGTIQVSRYQKGKINLDFTEARDSEWHWHQLGHMQVCTSLQTDNHTSTPPLSFLQAGCPSCRPTNSVKALKAYITVTLFDSCIWLFY